MKPFLKSILIFCSVFFLIDKLFLPLLIISPTLEKDDRLEKIIQGKMNKDILIFGSSRGARNIIASQIEDALDLDCYNLSYPGSNIEFHEFLLEKVLQFNSKPKKVLLAIDDPSEFLPSESILFRYDRLYPLARYGVINNELIQRGENTWLSKFLVLARISEKSFDLREKQFSALDSIKENGSMPIYTTEKDVDFSYDPPTAYEQDRELETKKKAFLEFQNLCADSGIELYLIYSPNYQSLNYPFLQRIKSLKHQEVNLFIYDTLNPIYQDPSYFYDESHLKFNGARVLTNEIIEELQKDLE